MHIHTGTIRRIVHPPSRKNVNKPAFKYNDLQRMHGEGEQNCKPVLINVALWLSERSTSPCLFSRRRTCALYICRRAACVCKPFDCWCTTGRSVYIPRKHVDAIKSFCSAVKSVNGGSEGGRDTGKLREGAREEGRSERRTSSRGRTLFHLIADCQ